MIIHNKEKLIKKLGFSTHILKVYGSSWSRHGFLVLDDNNLFAWGLNDWGQLGVGGKKNKHELTVVPFLKSKKIKKVCCGVEFSLFLTEDDKVYSVGGNLHGQLCLGHEKNRDTPDLVLPCGITTKVVDISCGCQHGVFICSDFNAYSFGCNYQGQLGVGDFKNRNCGTKIILPEKILSATCGGFHTFFLSVKGNIYGCGLNVNGEIGMTKIDSLVYPPFSSLKSKSFDTYLCSPEQNLFFKDKIIVDIAAGDNHSLFLSSDLQVYSCGSNKKYQLGLGSKNARKIPTLVSTLKNRKIFSIKCGYERSMFIGKKKIWFCGANKKKQISYYDKVVKTPIAVERKYYFQVLFIGDSTIYFTKRNEVFGRGGNTHGELFCGKEDLSPLKKFKIKKHRRYDEQKKEVLERFDFLKSNQKVENFFG